MALPKADTSKLIKLSEMPQWLELVINTDGSVMLRSNGTLRELSIKPTGQPQFIQLGPVPGGELFSERVPLTGFTS